MRMNTMKNIIEKNQHIVLELFKGRCALNPAHTAAVVHEIEMKSLRPKDWWELDNMIPLCNKCHTMVHSEGTKKWRSKLRKARESVN